MQLKSTLACINRRMLGGCLRQWTPLIPCRVLRRLAPPWAPQGHLQARSGAVWTGLWPRALLAFVVMYKYFTWQHSRSESTMRTPDLFQFSLAHQATWARPGAALWTPRLRSALRHRLPLGFSEHEKYVGLHPPLPDVLPCFKTQLLFCTVNKYELNRQLIKN